MLQVQVPLMMSSLAAEPPQFGLALTNNNQAIPSLGDKTMSTNVLMFPAAVVLNAPLAVSTVATMTADTRPIAASVPVVSLNPNWPNPVARLIENENEKQLNEYVKRKVSEQIKAYNQEQLDANNENAIHDYFNSLYARYNYHDYHCHNHHQHIPRELTLDEKIGLIRRELNLPPEKEKRKLVERLNERKNELRRARTREGHHCHHDHDHDVEDDNKNGNNNDYELLNWTPSTKYQVNMIKPRESRSLTRPRSAHSRSRPSSAKSKSRSPSSSLADRPPWRSTCVNDYTATRELRANMLNDTQWRGFVSNETPQNSLQFFDHLKAPAKNEYNSLKTRNVGDYSYPAHKTNEASQSISYSSINNTQAAAPFNPPHSYLYYYPTSTNTTKSALIESTATNNYAQLGFSNVTNTTSYSYDTSNFHYLNNNMSQPSSNGLTNYYTTKQVTETPYYYETVSYPSSSNYYNYPSKKYDYIEMPTQTKFDQLYSQQCSSKLKGKQTPNKIDKVVNLAKLDKTKHGTIYANPKKDEVHYISDATKNKKSNKTSPIKIINSGTTVIHE
jgi:hypothetical protein